MNSFTCPFCNGSFPLIPETYSCYESSFTCSDSTHWGSHPANAIFVRFYKCPNCNEISIKIDGQKSLKDIHVPIYPKSLAKQFPQYIPKSILEDYKEAYSIVNLSPKASATLARRCLQGMIRDFWNIKKPRLIERVFKK